MVIYKLINFFAPFAESCMFFLIFEAFLERDERHKEWQFAIGIIGLAALIGVSNHFLIYSLANIFVLVVFGLFICSVFYKGAMSKKLLSVVITILISGIFEVCAAHLVALVSGVGIERALILPSYRAIGVMIAQILGIFTCNIIRVRSNLKYFQVGRAYWGIFFLLFVSSVFAIFLISKLTYEFGNQTDTVMAIVCAIGMFFITFFTIYLYERLAKQSEAIRAQERYEEHMRSQLSHLTDLVAKQEEIRGMKHDMKNQLTTIQGYLKNDDVQGGLAHISQLLANQQLETLSVNTGNLALDTLLSVKKAVAEKNDISFTMQVQIPEHLFISTVDQCVIFGNALDNAIEACERCSENNRFIDFFLIERKGRLVCKITNPLPSHSSKDLSTTKPDKENHGFGLVNIRRALAHYDIEPVFEQKEGHFMFGFVAYEQQQAIEKIDNDETPSDV